MLELIWITFLSVLSVLLVTVGMGAITEDETTAQKRAKKNVIADASRKLKGYGLNPHVRDDDVHYDPSEISERERLIEGGITAGTFDQFSGEVQIYTANTNEHEVRIRTEHELDHRGAFIKRVAPSKKLRKRLNEEWSDTRDVNKIAKDYNSYLLRFVPKTSEMKSEFSEEMRDISKNPEDFKDWFEYLLERKPDRFSSKKYDYRKLTDDVPDDTSPLLEASAYYSGWLKGRENIEKTLQKYGNTKQEKAKYVEAFAALKGIHDYITRKGNFYPEAEKIALSEEEATKIVKSIPQYVGSVQELSDIFHYELHNREYEMPFKELAEYAKIAQKSGTDMKDVFGEYRGLIAIKHFKNKDVDLK